MAQRRMFSLKIIDTDEFIDMPTSSRLLYYDLSMRADDDGFVASPKKIIKMIGASDDDFKILIAKKFVIPFESGVCVIKHWKVHNLIRSDRYTETFHSDEKKSLIKHENGTYLIKEDVIPDVIPDDNQMEPQVRLGEVRLGEESKELLDSDESSDSSKRPNSKDLIVYYLYCYKEHFGTTTTIDGASAAAAKRMIKNYGYEKSCQAIKKSFEIDDKFLKQNDFSLKIIQGRVNPILRGDFDTKKKKEYDESDELLVRARRQAGFPT